MPKISVFTKNMEKDGDEICWIYNLLIDINKLHYDFITDLSCANLGITELPFLPTLNYLECISNNLTSIPNYPKLKLLSCSHNKIRQLGDYPLLEKLYIDNNGLTHIGDCPNLIFIQCRRNKLTEIGNYPFLETLLCSNNNISSFTYDYPNLVFLQCQYNNLSEIPFFRSLRCLHCQHNNLTTIHEYPILNYLFCDHNNIRVIPELEQVNILSCSNNQLRELPNIINWRELTQIHYYDNEIDYIPPNIVRFLNNLRNTGKAKRTIYTDGQNVHNHQIQSSICESIKSIIKDKPSIGFDKMFQEILASQTLTQECKNVLIEFSQDEDVHSALNITFKELLLSVWSIIRSHQYKDEICNILNIEMNDSICKCFTGRISRLVNSLNGFEPRIKIEMAVNEQIANIIIIIEKQLRGSNDYTVEKHRVMVSNELTTRGFSPDEISVWVDNIE
jgi:hypothetical protein